MIIKKLFFIVMSNNMLGIMTKQQRCHEKRKKTNKKVRRVM